MPFDANLLEIKRYCHTYLDDLHFLFTTVFGTKIKKRRLKAKYDSCVPGLKDLSFIAFYDRTAIAFFGAIPYPFHCSGKRIIGCQACDSMTLSNFRGNGIQKKLAIATADLMDKEGISFAFALNSSQSWEILKNLGWKNIGPMARFHIPLTQIPNIILRSLLRYTVFPYPLHRAQVLKGLAVNRGRMNNCHGKNFLAVEYSDRFLEYKQSLNNCTIVEVKDCLLWVKITDTMNIGAITGMTSANITEIMDTLRTIGNRLLLKEITIHISRDTPEFELLAHHYQPSDSWIVSTLEFRQDCPSGNLRLNYADHDNF